MNSEKFNNSIWMLNRLAESNPREDSVGDKIGDAYTNVKNFIARNTGGVQHMNATAMTEEDYDSRMKSTLSELKSEALELHAQMLNGGASPEEIERMANFAKDVQKFEKHYDEQKGSPELMKFQLAALVNAASIARDGVQETDINFDDIDLKDIEIKPVEMPMYTAEPVTIDIDIDGDGISEPVEIKPVEMPMYTAEPVTIDIDIDGDGISEPVEIKPVEMPVGNLENPGIVNMPFELKEPSDGTALGEDPDLIQQLPGTYYGMGGENVGEPHFGMGGDNSDIPAEWLMSFEAEAYTGDSSLASDAMQVIPMNEALISNLQNLNQEQSDPEVTMSKGLSL